MDDTYQVYLNRVVRQTLPERYLSNLQHIQESPKFKADESGTSKPVHFPGYSVITPTWKDDLKNPEFYQHMQECQTQLLQQIPGDWLVPLPPESFHFTLADLIWADAYQQAIATPKWQDDLHAKMANIFEECSHLGNGEPIHWQVFGIMVSNRSIGVLLVPVDEQSYERIVQLRRAIYQNQGLIGLGIEQNYDFTGHITLAYFGKIPPTLDREALSVTLTEFNNQWIDNPKKILVDRAELRQFEDMTEYSREADWPSFVF